MKVTIGPYKNWVGPYQIVNAIFFWQEKYSDSKRWDYRLSSWLGDKLSESFVSDLCQWIDKKRKRKVKIHIDNYDTWNMDHTLSLIITPMLKQLKNTQHGHAFIDPEDVPHIGKGEDDEHGGFDSLSEERWNWALDAMIWSFEQVQNEDEYEPSYLNEDGTYDLEERNKYNSRVKIGLTLFGKYYNNLWD